MKKHLSIIVCISILLCLISCTQSNKRDDTTATTTEKTETSTKDNFTVFETENIARITFYASYGYDEGIDVPKKYMPEIISWLGTFTVGGKVPEVIPPGTNTVFIEIEYSDGKVIKNGLDTVDIDGITFYTEHAKEPDCYFEILSR